MELYQWLCVLAVPNAIGFFWVAIFTKRQKKREEQVAARRAEIERQQEEIKRQNEIQEQQNKAAMLGIQALLRDRLLQAFKQYLSQGYAEYDDRENVRNMYTQYESLGPNSVMDDLYKQFTDLPMQL